MKREGVIVIAVICLGVGFLLGRLFPGHHYERLGQTALMLDTASGKLCSPWKRFQQTAIANSDPAVAVILFGTASQPKDGQALAIDLVPACGKE